MEGIGDCIKRLIRAVDEDCDLDDNKIANLINYLTSDEVGVTREKHLHLLTIQDLPPGLNIVQKRLVLLAFQPKKNADRKQQQVSEQIPPDTETPVDCITVSHLTSETPGSKTPSQGIQNDDMCSPIGSFSRTIVGNSFENTISVSSPVLGVGGTVSLSFDLNVSKEGSQKESSTHDNHDISISSQVLMNSTIQRSQSDKSEGSKSNSSLDVEKYFTPEEWKKMSEIEQIRANNMLELYHQAISLGLSPKMPAFMQEKTEEKRHPPSKKQRVEVRPTRVSERLKNASVRSIQDPEEVDTGDQQARASTNLNSPDKSADEADSSIDSMINEDKARIRLPGQYLKYPTPLPEFGEMARKNLIKPAHERNMSPILSDCKTFIRRSIGGTYLTKTEYDDFSRTLVEKYPALQATSAKTSWLVFKKSLSASFRAIRARKKSNKKQNKNKKNTDASTSSRDQPSTSTASADHSLEYSPRLKELQGEKRIKKIVSLLKATENERRNLVDKVPYFQMLEDFPYLRIPDMVLYDFTLIKNLPREDMQLLIDSNLDKLQKYFEVAGEEEVSKFRTIEKLHEHFITAAVKKNGAKPVFCMVDKEEVFQSLQSSEVQAPFVVVHTSYCEFTSEEIVKSAAIMAKSRLLFSIDKNNLTAARVSMLLLAVYAIHQVEYPRPYMEFLRALERFCTGSCAPSKYGNTKAKFDRLLSAIESRRQCE